MKEQLQELLNQINSLYVYDDDTVRKYTHYIEEVLNILEDLPVEPGKPVLESWRTLALAELSGELANRFLDDFYTLDLERKRNEFKFSKSVVSVSITNVIMNM
jgi:hypothetical protein